MAAASAPLSNVSSEIEPNEPINTRSRASASIELTFILLYGGSDISRGSESHHLGSSLVNWDQGSDQHLPNSPRACGAEDLPGGTIDSGTMLSLS